MKILEITNDSMQNYVVRIDELKCDTKLKICNKNFKVFAISGYSVGMKISCNIYCGDGTIFYPQKKGWKLGLDILRNRVKKEELDTKIAIVNTQTNFEDYVCLESVKDSVIYTFKDKKDWGLYKALRKIKLIFNYRIDENNAEEVLANINDEPLKKTSILEFEGSKKDGNVSSIVTKKLKKKVEELDGNSINLSDYQKSINEYMKNEFKEPIYGIILSGFNAKVFVDNDESLLSDGLKNENKRIRSERNAEVAISIDSDASKVKLVRKDNESTIQAREGEMKIKQAETQQKIISIEDKYERERKVQKNKTEIEIFNNTPMGKIAYDLFNDPSFREWLYKMMDQSRGGILSSSHSDSLTKLLQLFSNHDQPKVSNISGKEGV